MIKTEFLLLSSILKTYHCEVFLPELITIALRIMLNYPDAFASAERSFSKLKLITTFNASYMTDSRLPLLAMLSVEASCVRSLRFG